MYYHVLQPKIFTKPGWAKPECVVTFSNIAVQANITVGEQCGNTQLLNGIQLLPCYIITILCRANAEKVTNYCIVFYGNMRGPHCGIAPLLRSIGGTAYWLQMGGNSSESTDVPGWRHICQRQRRGPPHQLWRKIVLPHNSQRRRRGPPCQLGRKLSALDQDKKDTQIWHCGNAGVSTPCRHMTEKGAEPIWKKDGLKNKSY